MILSKHALVLAAVAAFVAVNFNGCCGPSCDGDKKAAPVKKDSDSKDATADKTAELSGPAAATYAFLDAARRGDDEKAKSMLTPMAREEIGRLKLNVAPPSSDTAKFDVGEVKNVSEEIAHVASRWTDFDGANKPQSHEMTWILRHVAEGWRIGGMATEVFEGEPPLLLNFEKPQEMLRQKQMLREEVARRAAKNR